MAEERVDLQTVGKMLLVLALAMAIVGGLLWAAGRLGLSDMPGNFRLQGEGWSCFVPLAASIVISVLLTIVLNVVLRWFR